MPLGSPGLLGRLVHGRLRLLPGRLRPVQSLAGPLPFLQPEANLPLLFGHAPGVLRLLHGPPRLKDRLTRPQALFPLQETELVDGLLVHLGCIGFRLVLAGDAHGIAGLEDVGGNLPVLRGLRLAPGDGIGPPPHQFKPRFQGLRRPRGQVLQDDGRTHPGHREMGLGSDDEAEGRQVREGIQMGLAPMHGQFAQIDRPARGGNRPQDIGQVFGPEPAGGPQAPDVGMDLEQPAVRSY